MPCSFPSGLLYSQFLLVYCIYTLSESTMAALLHSPQCIITGFGDYLF